MRNTKPARHSCLRMTVAILLAVSMLLAAGCTIKVQPVETEPQGSSQPTEPTIPTTEAVWPVTEPEEPTQPDTEPEETSRPTQPVTEPTVPPPTEQYSKEASLKALRNTMTGTSQLFAVAYFGYHEPQEPDVSLDPYALMQANAPVLCSKYPFMLDIPRDHVVGEAGDLFCIIPLDPDAAVAVSKGYWDEENQQTIFDDMIYSSDSGEPIVLFCNDHGWEPDTQLYISGPSGEQFWYPGRNDDLCITPLLSDNDDSLLLDFTAYRELLAANHRSMKKSGWVLPTEEALIGKTWGGSEILEDGREFSYQISFDEEVCSIRWNDGFEEQECSYPQWELTNDGSFAVLTVDLFTLDVVKNYNVLYNVDSDMLYVTIDITQSRLTPGSEPLYRYLSHFSAPEPQEMVGKWESVWTELEGYREESETGRCVVEISLDDSGLYWISYTDTYFPEQSFSDKELIVFPGEMYMGCGNDQWTATINYTGSDGVEYTLTVLSDGTLLMQQYWEMDGAPNVSYSGYQRVS